MDIYLIRSTKNLQNTVIKINPEKDGITKALH